MINHDNQFVLRVGPPFYDLDHIQNLLLKGAQKHSSVVNCQRHKDLFILRLNDQAHSDNSIWEILSRCSTYTKDLE